MSPTPKVSVILTSYNHAKYLRHAIESVLSQTFSDFELIIWDDASTDESWEIISNYQDVRIRAFRNPVNMHRGNINRGLEQSQGEYIAIHHSDDIWEPEKLEKQVAFLDSHPEIGAVFTWAQIIDEEGNPFQDKTHSYYKIFEQPNRTRYEWLNYFFLTGNALAHPSVLIRKKVYEDVGIHRSGLAQIADFEMWVRVALKYDIHVIPEKLIRFRVRLNEANSSGDRPETRVRIQFEYLHLLDNYRGISSFDELKKVFPGAERYDRHGEEVLPYILGVIAVEGASSQPFRTLFGLNLLFEVLQDPVKARNVERLYGFSNLNFIALTAQHDVFSVEVVRLLYAQLAERDRQLAEIYSSRGWRLLQILRRVRWRLLPAGSRREGFARFVFRALRAVKRRIIPAL